MIALDINVNGAWRVVMRDVQPIVSETVKQACIDLTASAVAVGGPKAGPSWRMRDADGCIFLRCEHDPKTEVTAWTVPARLGASS